MKLKLLFSLIIGLIALTSSAQNKPITPKYGVVDIDSILMSIPETKLIYQNIDSVQNQANKTAEPLAIQFQEKMNQHKQMQFSGDSTALKNLEADTQLLYQELNLIEQKTRRTLNGYQQELFKLLENIKTKISIVGEQMQLTFVIAKKEQPIYTSLGLPILLPSPIYYSGEAVDITDNVIKEVFKKESPKANNTSKKSRSHKSK